MTLEEQPLCAATNARTADMMGHTDSLVNSQRSVCPFGGYCPQTPVHAGSQPRKKKTRKLRVLMYHRVCPDGEGVRSPYVVTKSTFRTHMQFLIRHGFCTPRVPSTLSGAIGNCDEHKQPILITFDDGYLDVYENALPVLQEFGLTAIVFVVTDFSRHFNWWDADGEWRSAELLQPRHIQEMAEAGIEFGIHSFTHPLLTRLGDDELQAELRLGKSVLELMVKQWFPVVAYPYGDVDERVKGAARDAGYCCGFASYSGPFRYMSDLFEIRRVFMNNHTSKPYLLSKIYGLDHALRWGVWRMKTLVGRH